MSKDHEKLKDYVDKLDNIVGKLDDIFDELSEDIDKIKDAKEQWEVKDYIVEKIIWHYVNAADCLMNADMVDKSLEELRELEYLMWKREEDESKTNNIFKH